MFRRKAAPLATVARWTQDRGDASIDRADRRHIVTVTADVDEERGDAKALNDALPAEVLPALARDVPGLGFSFEEVEDLRLAVADVCTKLLAAVPEAEHLDVTFVVGDGHLAIDVAIDGTDGIDHRADFDEITTQLSDASVDRIEFLEDHGVIRVAKTHVEED